MHMALPGSVFICFCSTVPLNANQLVISCKFLHYFSSGKIVFGDEYTVSFVDSYMKIYLFSSLAGLTHS